MKKLFFLILFCIACSAASFAASVSVSLVTAPCNNNGVLQATATGFTGTVTYTFYGPYTTVTNTTGTLTGYSGAQVYVYASAGGTSASTFYTGAPPFNYTVATTAAVCTTPGSATATITGGTSPYMVLWYQTRTTTLAATGTSVSLPAGGYDVFIMDAAGCTYGSYAKGDSIAVPYNSPVSVAASSTVASCTTGTATATPSGGTSPYSYTWSNGAHTTAITGLVMGYYQVTATDAAGCIGSTYVYVSQSPLISVNTTVTSASCLLTNGSAIAFGSGGTPPYTYLWSNLQTTQTATALSNGSYSVRVADANGCTGQGYAYISASTPITATYSATASACTTANGSATVTAAGGTAPYTIVWNTFPVQTGTSATGLAPGTYQFTITDATGCKFSGAAIIPPVSIINTTLSSSAASCIASNGSASVAATGGTTPYTYLWSTSAITSSVSSLASGIYSVSVTDAIGCSVTKSVYVGRTSPVSLGIATTQANCLYNANGSVAVTTAGGTSPYTYSWSGGSSTTSTLSSLTTGNYYVTVTDAAGCQTQGFAYVGYNAANTSCYCTITGTVYKDANSNCTQDPGEGGIPNIQMHCSGRGYTYTNSAGVYSFRVPTGTYTLSQTVQAFYPLTACQTNSVSVSVTAATGCSTTVNFADSTLTIHDMKSYLVSLTGPPVPGNNYYQAQIVGNDGTVTESSILGGYQHDGQLNAPSSVPSAWSLAGTNHYANNSGFTTLTPGGAQFFYWQYSTPTNIPIYTGLTFKDSAAYTAPISNWLNDYTPWNNVNTY